MSYYAVDFATSNSLMGHVAKDGMMMMKDFIAPHFGSRFEDIIPGGNNILTFPR